MELEGIGLIATSRKAADYESTLAAFDELEKRIGVLMGSITALEAKVDAPRVSSNTWNVVSWKQCPKCGTWYCRSHNCDPDTCGNCKKPWRRDKDKGLVLCYEESDSPQYKANGVPACPCYERRKV